jgi:hypothetical protein
MHIPDGFLDTKTIMATSVFSLVGVGRAVRVLKTQMSPTKVPGVFRRPKKGPGTEKNRKKNRNNRGINASNAGVAGWPAGVFPTL